LGGPAPIGARKANLSDRVEPYMQEIALSEQVSVIAWEALGHIMLEAMKALKAMSSWCAACRLTLRCAVSS